MDRSGYCINFGYQMFFVGRRGEIKVLFACLRVHTGFLHSNDSSFCKRFLHSGITKAINLRVALGYILYM